LEIGLWQSTLEHLIIETFKTRFNTKVKKLQQTKS